MEFKGKRTEYDVEIEISTQEAFEQIASEIIQNIAPAVRTYDYWLIEGNKNEIKCADYFCPSTSRTVLVTDEQYNILAAIKTLESALIKYKVE